MTSHQTRIVGAVAAGAVGAIVAYLMMHAAGDALQANDFTYSWVAARAVARGADPYATVAATPLPWGSVLFYPFPAALLVLPLAALPVQIAGALFVGAGVGLLAFALARETLWGLSLLASASVFHALRGVQWSPLLTGAALYTGGLGLAAAKPNLALPLLVLQTRRRSILAGAVVAGLLTALSFALMPSWASAWIHALRSHPASAQYRMPIASPLGVVLALAALRWRRPEARLLLCMALMPQNGFFYDQLPLVLVPRRRSEMLAIAAISQIAYLLALGAVRHDDRGPVGWSNDFFPYMVAGVYLPALILILLRPNEGNDPVWVRRLASRLPHWLRDRDR